MGSGVAIKCNNCDYYKKFRLGCGRMNFAPEQLQKDKKVLEYVEIDDEKTLIADILDCKNGEIIKINPISAKIIKTLGYTEEREEGNPLELDERAKDFGYMLCHCQKCNTFYSKFMFSIRYNDGIYIHNHKCPDCIVDLSVVRELDSFTEYKCPSCMKNTLENARWGVKWD